MICKPCRDRAHACCPEAARQRRTDLSETDKAGSSLCDCQHEASPATAARADAVPGILEAIVERRSRELMDGAKVQPPA